MLSISEEVLSALVKNEIEPEEIVKRLATCRPDVLLQLLHMDDLIFQVQDAFSHKPGESNIVSAIKKYRELTGTQLKEAKLAVERMIDKGDIRAMASSPEPEDRYDYSD